MTKEEYLEQEKADPAKIMVVFNPARVKWMPNWFRMPHMTVGSDAMWSGLDWDEPFEKYSAIPAQRDHTRKLFLWAVSWAYHSCNHCRKSATGVHFT